MFGTLGFSELIIILVIVLIIFGAGRLPQIGEGVGKALKGFKKEVNEVPPAPETGEPEAASQVARTSEGQQPAQAGQQASAPEPSSTQGGQPYKPGPELTPGTTAALAAGSVAPPPPPQPQRSAQPSNQPAQRPEAAASAQASGQPAAGSQPPNQPATQPMSMEQRQQAPPPASRPSYPAVPPSAKAKPGSKRPSAIVNKDAVARVRAQQAEKRAQQQGGGPSPEDMQNLGEGVGDTLRTFRQAVSDVRNTIDPEMRTIQAEMEAAQKEIEDSVEAARQSTKDQTPPANS